MLESRVWPSVRLARWPWPALNTENGCRRKAVCRFVRRHAGPGKLRCDFRRASALGIATSGLCAESHEPAEWPDLFHSAGGKGCFLRPRLEQFRLELGEWSVYRLPGRGVLGQRQRMRL